MLKPIGDRAFSRQPGHFAIVASKYNLRYVNGMLTAARARLTRTGLREIVVVRVPGAFEIPLVAATLARNHRPRLKAIICLGVIIKGETRHADYISQAIALSLARLQLQGGIPMVHEVLLLENEEQAKVRCLSRKYNRGLEAANTALEMSEIMERLDGRMDG